MPWTGSRSGSPLRCFSCRAVAGLLVEYALTAPFFYGRHKQCGDEIYRRSAMKRIIVTGMLLVVGCVPVDPPSPPAEQVFNDCQTDAECSDGNFCNGNESCQFGNCVSGSRPCIGEVVCLEAKQACTPKCQIDAECSDGNFCNGKETCFSNYCIDGQPPCEPGDCIERGNTCSDDPEYILINGTWNNIKSVLTNGIWDIIEFDSNVLTCEFFLSGAVECNNCSTTPYSLIGNRVEFICKIPTALFGTIFELRMLQSGDMVGTSNVLACGSLCDLDVFAAKR